MASATHTDVDVVRSAMKLFSELGMVEIAPDRTIWIEQAQRMVGKETDSAERMRAFRERHAKEIASHGDTAPSRIVHNVAQSGGAT